MNKRYAKSLLRKFTPHCVRITGHCKKRMRERDVVIDDILYVMMWGEVTEIEEDHEYHNWKCRIEGKDTEEDDLTVIAALDEKDEIITCLTVC